MVNKLLEEQKPIELEFGAIYTGKILELRNTGVLLTLQDGRIVFLLRLMLSLDCLRWRADVPAQQSAEREEGLSPLRARAAGWRPAPGEILWAGPGHGAGQAQQEGSHLGSGGRSGGSFLSILSFLSFLGFLSQTEGEH